MKSAVIYWSGTGNTEMMAKAIAEGAEAELFSVSKFKGLIINETPSDDDLAKCKEFGENLIK